MEPGELIKTLDEFMAPESFQAFRRSHSRIENWRSMDFQGFGPPHFNRMHVRHKGFRVNLHLIDSIGESDPLYHCHPWPSVMMILRGSYFMDVGSVGLKASRLHLPRFAKYELHQGGWHSVWSPEPVLSLMLTWHHEQEERLDHFKPLSRELQSHMLSEFFFYGARYGETNQED